MTNYDLLTKLFDGRNCCYLLSPVSKSTASSDRYRTSVKTLAHSCPYREKSKI